MFTGTAVQVTAKHTGAGCGRGGPAGLWGGGSPSVGRLLGFAGEVLEKETVILQERNPMHV